VDRTCLVKHQCNHQGPLIYRLCEDSWDFLRLPQWVLVFAKQLVTGMLAPRPDMVPTHLLNCGTPKMVSIAGGRRKGSQVSLVPAGLKNRSAPYRSRGN